MEDFDVAQAEHIARHSQDPALRHGIACIANLISLCNERQRSIGIQVLADMYTVCVQNNVSAAHLLDPTIAELVVRGPK